MQQNAPIRIGKHPNGNTKMADITDAGPRLRDLNDRLEELRTAADQADAEYRAEIKRLRLTDEEREVILAMACHCDTRCGSEWVVFSSTLRGLLTRLGGER